MTVAASESPDRVIVATTALNFDGVASESAVALDLVSLCAFLAPNDIPYSLLIDGSSQMPRPLRGSLRDPLRLIKVAGILSRYAVVEVDGNALTIHGSVQEIARK